VKARLALLLALCAACSLEPKYTRPRAPVPAQLPQGEAYSNPTTQTGSDAAVSGDKAALSWRALFLHPSLRRFVTVALGHNRDLRAALADMRAARAQHAFARAQVWPNIGISAGADLGTMRQGRPLHDYSLLVGAEAFEIDVFGRLRSLSNRARELYFSSQAQAQAVRLSLISETARAWLTLCANRSLLEIARQTQEGSAEFVRLTRSRFEGGIASELDVRQAETVLAQARSDVASYTTAVAQSENALRLLAGFAGKDSDMSDVPGDFAASEGWLALVPAGVDSRVLLTRPEVQAAEHALRSAHANIGAARAAYFPRISLTAFGGFISDALSSLLSAGALGFRASPAARLPIFTAGANDAQLELAQAQRERYLADYEQAIQFAFRDAADALARRGTIEEQLSAQHAWVAAADSGYQLADARYRAGAESYLQALDAQRTLYTARRSLVLAQRTRAESLVALYRVLGKE
jgi:multidrug efflux system outer membrane protein